MKIGSIATTACLIGMIATAQAESYKTFKGWMVKVENDRFDDGTSVIAASIQNGFLLGLRCIKGETSVALTDLSKGAGRYSERDILLVKFRADKKPILETGAMALDDKMIQFVHGSEMLALMKGTKEFAYRIEFKGVTLDRIFDAGEADQAIQMVEKACSGKSAKR